MDTAFYAKHVNYAPIAEDTDAYRRYQEYCRNRHIEGWLDSDKLSAALGFEQWTTEDLNLAIFMATGKSAAKVPPFKKERKK